MNRYRRYGIALLAGVLLFAGWAGNAMAWTDACTTISNRASLTYSVGGVPETTPVLSDDPNVGGTQATEFKVATRVDLTVAWENAVPWTATGQNNVMTFSITNTGNDLQRYSLRLWAAASGYDYDGGGTYVDNFDMSDTNIRVYTYTDNNFANGGTTLVNATAPDDGTHLGYTGNVAGNNGVIYVHVVADVPPGQSNGDNAIYALQAVTSQAFGVIPARNGADGNEGTETDETANTTNGCGSAVVLADTTASTGTGPGGAGPGGVTDGTEDGDAFAVGVYTVDTAAITMTKSYQVIWDPINGNAPAARAIPGARVEYTMTITNNSTTQGATDLSLIDQIPLNTDFYGGSISMPVGAAADYSTTALPGPPVWGAAAPANGVVDPNITFIKVDSFDLAASGTAEVKFTVVIE